MVSRFFEKWNSSKLTSRLIAPRAKADLWCRLRVPVTCSLEKPFGVWNMEKIGSFMLAFSVSYEIIILKLFVKMTYLYPIIHALDDYNAFNSLRGHSSQSNIHSELFSSSIVVFV